MQKANKFNQGRIVTHLSMILFCGLACWAAAGYAPNSTLNEVITIGTGYAGLLLMAVSLLIGPLNLLRKRRNPVNINLRRDIGIWGGIAGLVHVIFSFQVNLADSMWDYFFSGKMPRLDLFGTSNYLGLIATVMMVALLVTSNQLSLKLLKGKRWKNLQRFNYPLVALVVLHTIAYLVLNLRESWFYYSVIGLSVVTIAAQVGGAAITLTRNRQRRDQFSAPATAMATGVMGAYSPVPAMAMAADNGANRRRFIITSGALVIGGFGAGAVIGRQFNAGNGEGGAAVADVPQPNQPPVATSTPVTRSASGQPTPAPANTTSVPPAGRTTAPSQIRTTAPATTTAAAASSQGKVLTTTVNFKPGSSLKFTTNTGEQAILVCHNDGSVKAFSASCTHRPYPLTYNSKTQQLNCALHNVNFDTNSGDPLNRPARTALANFKVQVDQQGNIVYIA